MSKPKKKWWGYVRRVLYAYPLLAEKELEDETEQREHYAVKAALEALSAAPDGETTRHIISAVFFEQTHTLSGAAMLAHISYGTAKRKQNAFIRAVGEYMGLT